MLPIPFIFESFDNESLKKILPAIPFFVSDFQNKKSSKIKNNFVPKEDHRQEENIE